MITAFLIISILLSLVLVRPRLSDKSLVTQILSSFTVGRTPEYHCLQPRPEWHPIREPLSYQSAFIHLIASFPVYLPKQ